MIGLVILFGRLHLSGLLLCFKGRELEAVPLRFLFDIFTFLNNILQCYSGMTDSIRELDLVSIFYRGREMMGYVVHYNSNTTEVTVGFSVQLLGDALLFTDDGKCSPFQCPVCGRCSP